MIDVLLIQLLIDVLCRDRLLECVERSEGRVLAQQRPRVIPFDETAVVQDGDFVVVQDRVEFVCDGDDGPIGKPLGDDFVNDRAALVVETGRSVDAKTTGIKNLPASHFIQYEHPTLTQHGTAET